MKFLLSALLFTAAVTLLAATGWPLAPTATAPDPPPATGAEMPRAGCLFENGFNVCAYGDADLKDSYLAYQALLGEPVSAFDSRCQTFRMGRLCYQPGNPPGWRVQFDNLGLQDLQAQGFTQQPNADLHPAVRDWILSEMDLGIDTTRVVGRVVSPPVCDERAGTCRQWTDKQLFVVPKDAVSAAQVQRAPLGLLSLHRPAEASSPRRSPPVALVVGVLLALVASVGLFRQDRGHSRSRSVTV